jgi:hypothetical protein
MATGMLEDLPRRSKRYQSLKSKLKWVYLESRLAFTDMLSQAISIL